MNTVTRLMRSARFSVLKALMTGTVCLTVTSCDTRSQSPTSPTETPQPAITAVYAATLTSSESCGTNLPAEARERTYTATLLSDGKLAWTGPTLNPPSSHRPISSATLSDAAFVFSVDIERDPQS